jgi:hypothetical protein
MIEGKDRQESIELTAAALGIPEAEAEFIVAIEMGEIDGDVVIEGDEDPTDVAPPPAFPS